MIFDCIVASAGNRYGLNTDYPTRYENVILVGRRGELKYKKIKFRILAMIMAIVLATGTILSTNSYALTDDALIEEKVENELQNALENDNIKIDDIDFIENSLTTVIGIQK